LEIFFESFRINILKNHGDMGLICLGSHLFRISVDSITGCLLSIPIIRHLFQQTQIHSF
jgi:hypothetical protein